MCFWAAWGHDLGSRKASSTRRCCQTTKHFAVLRAFPGYCYSLTSQYFLLRVFSLLGWRPGMNLWGLPFPLQLKACLHPSCSGCSDTSSAGLRSAPHICCAHFCPPWGLDPSCITASAILCVGRRAPARNWPASSAPPATCWKQCDKPFSKLWISRTQLICCPLCRMDDNAKVSKNYSLLSCHP